MVQVELVVDAKAMLGEGPTCDFDQKRIYWVDILGKKLHWLDWETNSSQTMDTPQFVTSVVPSKKGELLVTLQHGFFSLDLETRTFTPIAEPEKDLPGNRFNDGKCDPAGRYWAGTMDHAEKENSGSLYCLERDFSVRRMFGNVGISNGMAWNKENTTMYYIDTPTRKIDSFDYDLETGNINNRRTVIEIPENEGYPDGMTIDEEGMLWVAHWGGYQVSRWNPRTGTKIDKVEMPVARVTSCAFGGDHLDELYITTARKDLSEDEWRDQPSAGGLFRVKTGIRGVRTNRFGM